VPDRSPLSLALIALTLGGCGDDTPRLGQVGQAVVGGVRSTDDDDAVVALMHPSGVCTGTLVADNLLLTARHCLTLSDPAVTRCSSDGQSLDPSMDWVEDYAPEQLQVYSGSEGPADGVTPAALGARLFSTESESICRNDIALVLLDRRLTDSPILPIRLFTGVTVGEMVSVVGYGTNGLAGESGRFRRDGLSVLEVGKSQYSLEPSVLVDRTFAVDTGPCVGDSGGPALSSEHAVMGVFSLAATDCTVEGAWNVFTQVAAFHELLGEAFEAAGAEPWFEGDPGPFPGGRAAASCQVGTAGASSSRLGPFVALLLALALARRAGSWRSW